MIGKNNSISKKYNRILVIQRDRYIGRYEN